VITVYHLRPSRSERILWLLEELGVDYEVEAFDRDPSFRAPAQMREVHPLGKSPMLRDGGRVWIESGAIVEHLVERYGADRLRPAAGTPEHARYREWLHFSEGSLMAWLVMELLVAGGLVPGVDPGPLAPLLRSEIERSLAWVDGELAQGEFAAGSRFSAADVMLAWALDFARGRGHTGGLRHVESYLDRMREREGWRRARERAA